MQNVDFWYDFASTYSYPAAMRIEALAKGHDIALRWRPFLLGPIFAGQGWRDSPFNIYAVKGRYMWRDLERTCAALGLAFRRPVPFPQNSLLAARTALALAEDARPAFSRAVFAAEFGKARPIAERGVISEILKDLGYYPAEILERAATEATKQKLRMQNDEAKRLGIFGAPCLVVEGGELFWGNDRLETGLEWAVGTPPGPKAHG
jgi:2-hydroxychromene-2-carboxylate isomerase